MANILSDEKKQQVIALGRLGWTLRRIEAATGVRRETAGAYLKAAGLAVRPPGRWGHPPAKPAIEVSTDSANPASAVSTDFGVGSAHPVEQHGFAARYASVRRFVITMRGQRTPEAHPVIVTPPGEEGQVDYGDGPMVRHPVTGKYRRTRLFVDAGDVRRSLLVRITRATTINDFAWL